MLSAFILGLALGALWIRRRADRSVDSIRSLGLVQWCMGLLALATLPLYVSSFEWISSLLATFARNDAGYTGFTIAKYAVCLIIMLPATLLRRDDPAADNPNADGERVGRAGHRRGLRLEHAGIDSAG